MEARQATATRQEHMSATWQQRCLPDMAAHADPVWRWEITASCQLTAARVQLRQELRGGPLPRDAAEDDIERLLLAFEELASNGLRHGRAPVDVGVYGTPAGWLIDVSDHTPDRLPSPAVDRDPANGGLGLHTIARLSADCGWQINDARKHVWACITPSR